MKWKTDSHELGFDFVASLVGPIMFLAFVCWVIHLLGWN